jgi:D-arabinose 5-phosphate isomerase GutQ
VNHAPERPRAAVEETRLWSDALALPESLAATLDAAEGFDELHDLLARPATRRIVATGNGASWYAALALWLASLTGPRADAPDVVAVPAGLLAGGGLAWRDGDVVLAVSSSGELRDLVEVVERPDVPPFGLVTADAGSTLGRAAEARALVAVHSQDVVTHTQAYCGAALVLLAAWARLTGDAGLTAAVRRAPDLAARTLAAAPAWAEEALDGLEPPDSAVAFGAGPGWAAALEAALLLGEIAGVPAQGVELREGATSAMYPLGRGALVLSLPGGPDGVLAEAEAICARRGAAVLRAPVGSSLDPRLAVVGGFASPLALAIGMALRAGLDPDRPAWYADYLATARLRDHARPPSG